MKNKRDEITRNSPFYDKWCELAEDGIVDAPLGSEYRRCLRLWIAWGRPEPTRHYLTWLAEWCTFPRDHSERG